MKLSQKAKAYLREGNNESLKFYLAEMDKLKKNPHLSGTVKINIKESLTNKLEMHNEINRFLDAN
jgi:hypothetical protein